MNFPYFKQKALLLANKIYPEKTGEELIHEADKIFKYMISNGISNFITHNFLCNDIVGFATALSVQDVYFSRTIPLMLHDYQESLLAQWQTGNDFTVLHARSMGVTMMIQIYALWLCSFKSEINMGIVVNSKAEKEAMVSGIISFYNTCSLTLPKIKNYTSSSISFQNDNKIQLLLPTTYVVGRSLSHVLSDNSAMIKYSDEDNFYSTIMLANVGQLICAGVPGADVGIFHEIANGYLINNKQIKLPYHLNPLYDANWENIKRKELSHEEFENQYNCVFRQAKY